MCKAIEDMRKEAKNENLIENIKTMNTNGADENTIAKLLSLDIEYVKKVLAS